MIRYRKRHTYALQKLDYYVSGAVSTIKTNHKPLQYLLDAEWTNKKIQQWTVKLSVNCKVEYMSRKRQYMRRFAVEKAKQLKAESVRVKPGVYDRPYQIWVFNFNRLKDRPVLETDTEGTHWKVAIKRVMGTVR